MYDALVNFIGTPPDECIPFLYLACIPFTMYLVDQAYSFLRLFLLRFIRGNS